MRRVAHALIAIAVLTVPVAGGAGDVLEYVVSPGDTISAILWQNIEEVEALVAGEERYASVRRVGLVYRLIANSPWVSSLTIRPGDMVRVSANGRLDVIGGVAPAGATAPAERASARRFGVTVGPGGATARVGFQIFRATAGIGFIESGRELAVVGTAPFEPFELRVAPRSRGAFEFPPNPYFDVAPGGVLVRSGLPLRPAPLLESGQVRIVDEMIRIGRSLKHPVWQKLYEARSDGSPYSAIRRKVAAATIIHLLETKLPHDETQFAGAYSRLDANIRKGWRAFEQDLSAAQIFEVLDHPFEISADRRTLYVDGRSYVTSEGLSFEYCSGHFHVVGRTPNRFSLVVDFPTADAAFGLPQNLFFEVQGNVLVPKPPISLWQELINTGQVELKKGHYFVTLDFHDPNLQRIKAVMDSPVSREVANKAREILFEVLQLTIIPRDEAGLRAALASVATVLERRYRDLEAFARSFGEPFE